MLRITYYEILKTFLKKRTYLGFAIVLVVVPLVIVAMKLEGGKFMGLATRSLQMDFVFTGNPFNGWFVAQWIMNSLWVHIPLLISFVAGDQLAGEATAGTYRLILIRPVSRTRIFVAKYFTTLLYVFVFVLFFGLLSVGLALALLGGGDLVVLGQGILIIPASELPFRFCLAYGFSVYTMMTIASIAFFFSSFVENAIGPIVGTMGVVIVFTLITIIPVELFAVVRTYLFTSYMNIWLKAFADPIPWNEIRVGLIYLGGTSLLAMIGAWVIFNRKDILS